VNISDGLARVRVCCDLLAWKTGSTRIVDWLICRAYLNTSSC